MNLIVNGLEITFLDGKRQTANGKRQTANGKRPRIPNIQ